MNYFGKAALRGSTSLCAAAVLAAGVYAAPAFAQDAVDEPACVDADNDGQCDTLSNADGSSATSGAIVVTGSRLRSRDGFNTPDPIQVITREETTQAGFNSPAEVLQSAAFTNGQAQINNSYGGFVVNGGPGVNTLSLRGLGPTRTLILLNGRRVAPAGSRGSVGSADLNVLPSAMIERIEVLNGGASSIYGSDAIAGVVNIITRNQFSGLYLEAQQNVPQAGAGISGRYSTVLGYNGDRFNVAASLEYYNRTAFKFRDADFTQCQTQNRPTGAGADINSGSYIDPRTGQPKCYTTGTTGESGTSINLIGTPNLSASTVALGAGVPAGYNSTCNRFRPNPAAGGALPGYECVGGGSGATALSVNIRDTFPQSLLNNDLVSPARIYTGFFQAGYELQALGDAELYTEVLVNRRKSSQLQSRQFTIDYPFGSPLIPTGLRFPTAFLGPQATNPGVSVGVRVFADYGNYENRQTVDYVKGLAGLRGNLPMDWEYDLYVAKAWSDSDYTTDLILTDRLNQSLDVVASGSGFACRNTGRGCVAAPALTPAVVGGQYPSDWFNFVVQPVTGHTAFREETAAMFLNGPLFALPGGDIQLGVGAEYRKSSIDDTPSIESQTGNLYNFTGSGLTRGSDSVWEIFGEAELPILRDLPFAYNLSITGSARYTNYKSYGGQTTYKVGGIFQPIREISLRGSYGTSYRAPALFEQFLGATSGFQSSASDPCNNLTTAASNPIRIANCAADGIPNGGLGFSATSSIRVLQRGGAESGLGAETSRNWTAGLVVQPNLGSFGRLSLSADYWNILVENGVSQLGFGTILQQCYDDPDFRAESICGLVVREKTAPYQLTVTTGYVNISTARASGWDFNARWELPVGPGKFRLNADVTKFDDRFTQTLPTDAVRDNIGTLNNPEWSGTFAANYSIGRVDLRYGVDWLSSTYSDADYLGVTQAVRDTYILEAPDYFLHQASVRWKGDNFSFTVGVRNLFDTTPPYISSGFYNRVGNAPLYNGFDYLGRTYFANISTKIK
ncbi:TonB-dependent receptor [Tsuneonella sp. YG55]|uniref:TonB-dependent receptor n=1 Tax=Tsuneonella litorea TaxID=2976475 RepID=A0A9X2W1P0_9SPHN|nr:TonB-dependent receptor [Tsuneonella litorea]MCT2559161.1 TonB-dependent receptor [Tsuneonella litorea]